MKFKFNRIRASGWYLEWSLNEEHILVIKSTAQETEKLIEETEKIKANLKEKCVKHMDEAFDKINLNQGKMREACGWRRL